MPYVMPLHREKAARRLAGMLRRNGPWIAEKLAPRMEKVLEEGEAMPDVAHLLDVLGRMVKAESKGLDAADAKRAHEGAEQAWARRELKEKAAPELRERVVQVRDRLRHFYDADLVRQLLDFEGRTPRGAEDLVDLADLMVGRLPILKPKKTPGVEVNPAAWAEYLKPSFETARDLLDQLGLRGDGVYVTVRLKKKALSAFDRTYRQVLRLAEVFYLLAGLERLAKKLRPGGGRPPEKIKKQTPGVA